MNEIEKMLKDLLYGGVGAVATVVEGAGDLAKTFVKKGETVVANGQTMAEKIGKQIKDACEKAASATGVDIGKLTREQRDALQEQLKQMAEAEDAAAVMGDVVNEIKDAVVNAAAKMQDAAEAIKEEIKEEIVVEAADEEDKPEEASDKDENA